MNPRIALLASVLLSGCGARTGLPLPELTEEASVPAQSTEPRRLVAGWQHTCSLRAGKVECWGLASNGQIGDGTTIDKTRPTVVAGLGSIRALAAGQLHTCALAADGTLQCWGDDTHGELGIMSFELCGETPCSKWPVKVPIANVAEVALGDGHTCARLVDGTVSCWGLDNFGQLGDGKTEGSSAMPNVVAGLSSVVQIVAASNHSCALISDGSVKCWGSMLTGPSSGGPFPEPVPIAGLPPVAELTTATSHTCARLADSRVMCWGFNLEGQLGDGTTDAKSTPTLVNGLSGVAAIRAGTHHTCARMRDGHVRCWGNNGFGQLGDDTNIKRLLPVEVLGLTDVVDVAVGYEHTCALTAANKVLCWGWNRAGQLGDGTVISHELPLSVD